MVNKLSSQGLIRLVISIVLLLIGSNSFVSADTLKEVETTKEDLFMRLPSSFVILKNGVKVQGGESNTFIVKSESVIGLDGALLKFEFRNNNTKNVSDLINASITHLTDKCIKHTKLETLQAQGEIVLAGELSCKHKSSKDDYIVNQYIVAAAYQGETSVFVMAYSWLLMDERVRDNTVAKIKTETLSYLENTKLCDGKNNMSCEEVNKQFIYEELKNTRIR